MNLMELINQLAEINNQAKTAVKMAKLMGEDLRDIELTEEDDVYEVNITSGGMRSTILIDKIGS